MSLRQWWRECLVAGMPMLHPAHQAVPRHMWPYHDQNQRRIAGWPKGIHSTTWYEDYLVWFEERYIPSISSPYYDEFPEKRPVPLRLWEFWNEMNHYCPKKGTLMRPIPVCEKSMDKWVNILRERNYRLIPDLSECVRVWNLSHPEDAVEAPEARDPSRGGRRRGPEDSGSWL